MDLIKTKRGWTIAMQFLMAFSLGAVGLFLPSSFFFTATLILFWLTAFFSATHDIRVCGGSSVGGVHDRLFYVVTSVSRGGNGL